MNVVAVGRSEILYDSILKFFDSQHNIVGVITDVGAPEYSKQVEDFYDVCNARKIPFLVSSNNAEISRFLDNLEKPYDIGISTGHQRKLDSEVISKFRLGILNYHGGDLPKYRGNACQAWAILNGEKRIAATVHKMISEEIDVGPIITKRYFEITENTYIKDIWNWLIGNAASMFLSSLSILESDASYCLFESENTDPGHRCYPRNPHDAKINWFDSNLNIHRLIRASGEPFYGAYTYYGNQKIVITRANIAKVKYSYSAIPGQILEYENLNCKVATGQGVIEISEINFEGNKYYPQQFFKGIRTRLENK